MRQTPTRQILQQQRAIHKMLKFGSNPVENLPDQHNPTFVHAHTPTHPPIITICVSLLPHASRNASNTPMDILKHVPIALRLYPRVV